MKISIDTKLIPLYLWMGLAYVALGFLSELSMGPGEPFARLVNVAWRAAYIVVVNFFFFEHALPFTKRRKNLVVRILLFLGVVWIQMMVYSFGVYVWRHIGMQFQIYAVLETFPSRMEEVEYGFPYSLFSMLFFGVIKHFYGHSQLKRMAQQLLIQKQEAELNYLKSQTNPHFLFNTLNNIYTLARGKSDLAPESLLRLSAILRFMLYETGGEYIRIEQEVKIIRDYLALEQLRYDESLRVTFDCEIADPQQPLPPLLLIPLVENAFKHGVSETSNRPFVNLRLSTDARQLEFLVRNSTDSRSGETTVKENIGLSNLRRQLQLLYSQYDLSVQQAASEFTARLTINLASHV